MGGHKVQKKMIIMIDEEKTKAIVNSMLEYLSGRTLSCFQMP